MLDDRSYMRAPQRQPWSMTTLLLISLVACYIVQVILEKELVRANIAVEGFLVTAG